MHDAATITAIGMAGSKRSRLLRVSRQQLARHPLSQIHLAQVLWLLGCDDWLPTCYGVMAAAPALEP
jgi:hypothetical protein